MISQDTIEEVKRRLIKTYNPLSIYIFGSYAWGTPHQDSDLDLMVIVSKSDVKPLHRAIEGLLAMSDLDISKELLVLTQQEFSASSQREGNLAYAVKHHGKCIFAQS